MQVISQQPIETLGNGRADYTDSADATVVKVIRPNQTYISWGQTTRIPAYTSTAYYYAQGLFGNGRFGFFEMHACTQALYSAPTPMSGWMMRVGVGYYDTSTRVNTEVIRGYGYGEVVQVFPCGVWLDELTATQYPSITFYNNNAVNLWFMLSLRGLIDYSP
jgi:hypothetical protein